MRWGYRLSRRLPVLAALVTAVLYAGCELVEPPEGTRADGDGLGLQLVLPPDHLLADGTTKALDSLSIRLFRLGDESSDQFTRRPGFDGVDPAVALDGFTGGTVTLEVEATTDSTYWRLFVGAVVGNDSLLGQTTFPIVANELQRSVAIVLSDTTFADAELDVVMPYPGFAAASLSEPAGSGGNAGTMVYAIRISNHQRLSGLDLRFVLAGADSGTTADVLRDPGSRLFHLADPQGRPTLDFEVRPLSFAENPPAFRIVFSPSEDAGDAAVLDPGSDILFYLVARGTGLPDRICIHDESARGFSATDGEAIPLLPLGDTDDCEFVPVGVTVDQPGNLVPGATVELTWSVRESWGDEVLVEVINDEQTDPCERIILTTTSAESFTWLVTKGDCVEIDTGYRIRVTDLTSGVSATSDPPFSITPPRPDLLIRSLAGSIEDPDTNDEIQFSVVVGNEGTLEAPASRLALTIGESTTLHDIPPLQPQESHTATRDTVITVAGIYLITAVADPDGLIEESSEDNNQTDMEIQIFGSVPPPADLELVRLDISPEEPGTDTEITIEAEVRNSGTVEVAASQLAIVVGDSTESFVVPALLPTMTHTATRVITLTEAGTYLVEARADSGNAIPESNEDNNVMTDEIIVGSRADLGLAIAASDTIPDEGDTVVFSITVVNGGPDDATGIGVAAPLPEELEYLTHEASQGEFDSNTGSWTIGDLGGDEATARLEITARIADGFGGESFEFACHISALVEGDPNPDNDAAAVTLRVTSADVGLSMEVDDSIPDEGDIVTFAVLLLNAGPDAATGVEVTDLIPDGLTLQEARTTIGSYDQNDGVWHVGDLGLTSQPDSLLLTVEVDEGTSGTHITNTAQITASNQADPDAGNNHAEQRISVAFPDAADLYLLDMEVDDLLPDEGDTITYTLTLGNGGPDPATEIVVSDQLPDGLEFVAARPSLGSYDQESGLWEIEALDNESTATLEMDARVAAGTGGTEITNRASVTASAQGDPDPDNDATEVTIVVTSADLIVTKTVSDADPDEGATISYTITVTNDGPDVADGIAVADNLPSQLVFQSAQTEHGDYSDATGTWNVGELSPDDGSATLVIFAQVAATGGETIENTAEITAANQSDPDPTNNTAVASITVASADLQLVKDVDDATPQVGDDITYTITLTNAGPSDASGIRVEDMLPAGVTYSSHTPEETYDHDTGIWDVGSLGYQQEIILQVFATVAEEAIDGPVENVANIVAADQHDPIPGNNSDEATISVSAANLGIEKTVADLTYAPGDMVEYLITLNNAGPGDATGIAVADTLPEILTFVSADPSQGQFDQATDAWTVGDLAADGQPATLRILAQIADDAVGGQIVFNRAVIAAAAQHDTDLSDNSSSVTFLVSSADLQLGKTVAPPVADVGDTVHFTIAVYNDGSSHATGVDVTDSLPEGLTYAGHSPPQAVYDSGTGIWQIGDLPAAGPTATLVIHAEVTIADGGVYIENEAEITAADQADPIPANNHDSASVYVTNADLDLEKTVDNQWPNEGEIVEFSVVVQNHGPDGASGIAINDILPDGLEYDSSVANFGSYDTEDGTWSFPFLPANGPTATLALRATVMAETAGDTIVNTAVIDAVDQSDSDLSNNISSAAIIVPAADLAIVKAVDDTTPSVGDWITYTIALANDGPHDATNIRVSDNLPSGVALQSTWSTTGGYDVEGQEWIVDSVVAGAAADTLYLLASVTADAAGDTVVNVAVIEAADQHDPQVANNEASASIAVTAPCVIAVTEPADGDVWIVGELATIHWTPSPCDDTVTIELMSFDEWCSTNVTGTPDDGTYELSPEQCQNLADGYRIRISGDQSEVSDLSPGTFRIHTGDSIDDPYVFDFPLPFFVDTRSTLGFADDYDEVCPYTNSTSPDVVYTFVPGESMGIDVDLQGSSYDTKIYIYDESMNLVACNDDFYPDYTSLLVDVPVSAGLRYFLVIDGYGGESGDYVLHVSPTIPCELDCVGGVPEGEPPLHNDYADGWNGGCNWDPARYQLLEPGLFCGVSGYYLYGGAEYRDTDWFEIVFPGDGYLEIVADAEHASTMYQLESADCDTITLLQVVPIGPCKENIMYLEGTPGTSAWIWIGPDVFASPNGLDVEEFEYSLDILAPLERLADKGRPRALKQLPRSANLTAAHSLQQVSRR